LLERTSFDFDFAPREAKAFNNPSFQTDATAMIALTRTAIACRGNSGICATNSEICAK